MVKISPCSSLQNEVSAKDRLTEIWNVLLQDITDCHEELDAHREIMKMIDDQITLHETFQREAPPQNRAM